MTRSISRRLNSRQRLSAALFLSSLAIAIALPVARCSALPSHELNLVTAFTTRGGVGLAGAPDGAEGTPLLSSFLAINPYNADSVVLEYDIQSQPGAMSARLDLRLANIDPPSYSNVSLYSFAGNGLADSADHARTDNYIVNFTDFGLGDNFTPPYSYPVSLDVTAAYNQAIADGVPYLGLLMENTPSLTRYYVIEYPTLTITVPEPATVAVGALAWPALLGRRGARRRLETGFRS